MAMMSRNGDSILCLPGYKAQVRLDSDVAVHLWGNVPEQMPPEFNEQLVVEFYSR